MYAGHNMNLMLNEIRSGRSLKNINFILLHLVLDNFSLQTHHLSNEVKMALNIAT